MEAERFALQPAALPADTNIRRHYPIHHGSWIAHPDIHPEEDSFCRYFLDFELSVAATIELHVSADNRFVLTCDADYIGMGPDRSDLAHWSFHSYRLALAPGTHRLSADVYFLHKDFPLAQTGIRPGFVLYAEHALVDLNTGTAPWKVVRLQGVRTERAPVKGFFVVGPNYILDAAAYCNPPEAVDAVVLQAAGAQSGGGRILEGWRLYPSRMPEQVRRPVGGGRIRLVEDVAPEAKLPADDPVPDPTWQDFVDGKASVTVPAQSRVTVLWDLEQYHCAYPELTTIGGAGALVNIEWAESCYEHLADVDGTDARLKGNRNEIAGKYFLGNGDTFLLDGLHRTLHSFWWRAGRYIRIIVEAADEPITLKRLRLLETRMPLENESAFACDDDAVAGIIAICVRGIQMCAHETYMDCPYYEQLMYVGDTRLQMLTSYVMSAEDRLNQRGIELFDWSRRETGYVLERYPSRPFQLSCTFAMIWVLMLRDHAWWRNEPAFVKDRMKGMRCLLEEFKAHQGEHDLLPPLPGWSFVDWVPGLHAVNSPGPNASVHSVVNLLFLNALHAAIDLEEHFGEEHLAAYNRGWADRLSQAILATFWCAERGMFADDPERTRYSEHAQCLALLSGDYPEQADPCFEALITAEDLSRTTVYFSFYVLETFQRFGRGDLIMEKWDFWKEMERLGFKTPMEMPEPSRSDCHAWGSHPLFHMHASLAGIRPADPGFKRVVIQPSPGSLRTLHSCVPHPAGTVSLEMQKQGNGWHATVSLPEGVTGTFLWGDAVYPLKGRQGFMLSCIDE